MTTTTFTDKSTVIQAAWLNDVDFLVYNIFGGVSSATLNTSAVTWSNLGTVTTADINGGTIDGVTIGGSSAGAITGTTITANTSLVGTLGTAAQPNITSLGTLTSLTVDNITINGAAITSDTGAISFGNENLSTTGTLAVSGGSTHGTATSVDYAEHRINTTFTSGGASNFAAGVMIDGAVTGHSGDNSAISVMDIRGNVTTGVALGDVAQLRLNAPTVTETGGAPTNASTLHIVGAPSTTGNDYAILVDSGDTSLGGDLIFSSGSDIIFDADGTSDVGKTGSRAANVWSDLINGADYGFENGWRVLESETYEGYGEGIAFDFGEHFEEGVAFASRVVKTGNILLIEDPNGDIAIIEETVREKQSGIKHTPFFAVTEDFIELKGRRVTLAQLDKLLALI